MTYYKVYYDIKTGLYLAEEHTEYGETGIGCWCKTMDEVCELAGWNIIFRWTDYGLLVSNFNIRINHDYLNIAHIGPDRSITIYRNVPPAIEQQIKEFVASIDEIPDSSIVGGIYAPLHIRPEDVKIIYKLQDRPENNAQKSF